MTTPTTPPLVTATDSTGRVWLVGPSAVDTPPDPEGAISSGILESIAGAYEVQLGNNPDGSAAYWTMIYAAGSNLWLQGNQVANILALLGATVDPTAATEMTVATATDGTKWLVGPINVSSTETDPAGALAALPFSSVISLNESVYFQDGETNVYMTTVFAPGQVAAANFYGRQAAAILNILGATYPAPST